MSIEDQNYFKSKVDNYRAYLDEKKEGHIVEPLNIGEIIFDSDSEDPEEWILDTEDFSDSDIQEW